jgi:hypothetical protein
MVNGQKINTVTITRFLGMDLDQQLGWSKHTQRLTENSTGLINMMRYIRGNRWGASTKTTLVFYKAFIRGKKNYASIVYDSPAITIKNK